jgi:hypothetical protein
MDAIGQIAARLEALAAIVRAAPPAAALRDDVRGDSARRDRQLLALGRRTARPDRGARAARSRSRARRAPARRVPDGARLCRCGFVGRPTGGAARPRHHRGPADAPPAGRPRPGRRSGPGARARCRPLADGTVPPPHWLVPFETETYVGRLALGADDPAPLALARAIARLVRLQPFASGNGRVARLVANLLAYRRGLPPIALDSRARRGYDAALRAALAGDFDPLARVVGIALGRGLERLRDAVEPAESAGAVGQLRQCRTALQGGPARPLARRPAFRAPLQHGLLGRGLRCQGINGELCRADERNRMKQPAVAYVSMEIAVAPHVATYSGGLGVLAGDVVRAAADAGYPMAAVTLLYRDGYFPPAPRCRRPAARSAAVLAPGGATRTARAGRHDPDLRPSGRRRDLAVRR